MQLPPQQNTKVNQSAFEVGQFISKMVEGYFAHLAAMTIAKDPRSSFLAPTIENGQIVPIGRVQKKDNTQYIFHFLHYLDLVKSDVSIKENIEEVWINGALLKIGDALSKHNYFDRAPELELIRHLRNGIAHGNTFRIDNPKSLINYPAHNKFAWIRSNNFEIDQNLQGTPVLFSFMYAGDILELFQAVSLYLIKMGNGDQLRP